MKGAGVGMTLGRTRRRFTSHQQLGITAFLNIPTALTRALRIYDHQGDDFMKRFLLSTALLAAAVTVNQAASADDWDARFHDNDKVTIAVFGDWPYGQILFDSASLLVNSINADRDVSLVIHVGDIHSGSQPCTSAGINNYSPPTPATTPPIATSYPDYNQKIFFQFQQIKPPVVYTPGDNEWTDCHKTKEFKSGNPLNELTAVRTVFFAQPGRTLGVHSREVWSQAVYFDPAHPEDKQYVENMMWMDADTIFVTLNVPGSNNDTLPWTNGFEQQPAHDNEVAARNAANSRWLAAAFKQAQWLRAKAVVIALQADMWDLTALAPGGDGLSAYTPFVQQIANLTTNFGKSSPTGLVHHTQSVPNLTRITVQGSTNAPAEWLKLTINTRRPGVFSWVNVPYCTNPAVSCP